MTRDELRDLIQLLKSEGVAHYSGDVTITFDPRALQFKQQPLYDDPELEDAASGEAKNELKRAQKTVQDDLFWST